MNIIFTIVAAILFRIVAPVPCEGLGCIGIGITAGLLVLGYGITLLTMPFLWLQIGVSGVRLDRKKIAKIVLVEIIFAIIIGSLAGIPLLKFYQEVIEKERETKSMREEKNQNERATIDEAIRSGLVFVPSKLPSGWKKETEAAYSGWVEITYVKKGIERQFLKIKQSIELRLREKSWEDKNSRITERDLQPVSIGDAEGVYFTWNTAACSAGADEVRELRWAGKNFERQLYCSCPCTLSKDELIEIAKSMKPL